MNGNGNGINRTFKKGKTRLPNSSRPWYISGGFIVVCLYKHLSLRQNRWPPPLNVSQTAVFYSANGKVLDEVHNGQKRYWVSLNQISPYVKDATLAVEDKRFYEHHGFDMHRIAGAIVADIKAMGKVQGASTITQQYARNLFLEHDKTWTRKLQEALYTIRLEMNYSKDQILEGYMNTIYYGHGAYGIEA